jgi:hypothetical protein
VAGKAPYDLIVENQLHGYLEYLMPSYTRTGRYPSNNLLHWPLFAFGTDYKGSFQEKQPYKVWEVCQDIVKSMKPELYRRKQLTDADRLEISQLYVSSSSIPVYGMANINIDRKTKKSPRSRKEAREM